VEGLIDTADSLTDLGAKITQINADLTDITPYVSSTVLYSFSTSKGTETYTPSVNAIIAGRIEPIVNHAFTIYIDDIEVGRAYIATNNSGVTGYGEAYYIPVKAGQVIKFVKGATLTVLSIKVYQAQS
jgi:hypothetical protein